MYWWMWLVVAVLLAAGEVHTQAFYALFLAAGAIVAALVSAIGGPLWTQAIIGAVAALAGVIAVRPAVKRLAEGRKSAPYRFPGMAGSLVGLRAVTVDMVGDEHHPGHALLAKERWLAVTDSSEPIPSDTEVIVAAVRGTTLLVRAGSVARLP
jgi:membrane protein implicated in regulation of membrane protease activity